MKRLSLILLGCSLANLVACSSAPSNAQELELDRFYNYSPYFRSHPRPDASPVGEIDSAASTPSDSINNPVVRQNYIVSGEIHLSGYTGGPIAIQAYAAEACALQHCVISGRAPLASVQWDRTGYFSLIVPVAAGEQVMLVANYGSQQSSSYLGEIHARVDGVNLMF